MFSFTTVRGCTQFLLKEIDDRSMNERQVGHCYALAKFSPETVEWYLIDKAVANRWGHIGLLRVKEYAAKVISRLMERQ